jgi:phosphoglycolate phosphatase-like HAD superfamily hydrolase
MDILAARAAGVPSVAVSTGPFTGTRLIEAEPDFLLSSVNDLPMLIETLNADRTVSR